MHDDLNLAGSTSSPPDGEASSGDSSLRLEQALLDHIRSGRQLDRLFPQVLDLYQDRVFWHVARMLNSRDDAMDVTQEIFVKVWVNLNRFEGRSRLYTWIYRIATNEALGWIRKHRKIQGLSLDDEASQGLAQIPAGLQYTGEEIEEALGLALAQLPPRQRQVFLLRYEDEMPYEEMSRVLDTSVGALKASYHHAVRKVEAFIRALAENHTKGMAG